LIWLDEATVAFTLAGTVGGVVGGAVGVVPAVLLYATVALQK